LNDWEMYNRLLEKTFFYLSFESSICRDYITDNFFYALDSQAVPIVMGPQRKTYERHAPSSSFIHVDDFQSPKELAHFLTELSKDTDRYLSYFHWKRNLTVERVDVSYEFCKYVHDKRRGDDDEKYRRFDVDYRDKCGKENT